MASRQCSQPRKRLLGLRVTRFSKVEGRGGCPQLPRRASRSPRRGRGRTQKGLPVWRAVPRPPGDQASRRSPQGGATGQPTGASSATGPCRRGARVWWAGKRGGAGHSGELSEAPGPRGRRRHAPRQPGHGKGSGIAFCLVIACEDASPLMSELLRTSFHAWAPGKGVSGPGRYTTPHGLYRQARGFEPGSGGVRLEAHARRHGGRGTGLAYPLQAHGLGLAALLLISELVFHGEIS